MGWLELDNIALLCGFFNMHEFKILVNHILLDSPKTKMLLTLCLIANATTFIWFWFVPVVNVLIIRLLKTWLFSFNAKSVAFVLSSYALAFFTLVTRVLELTSVLIKIIYPEFKTIHWITITNIITIYRIVSAVNQTSTIVACCCFY